MHRIKAALTALIALALGLQGVQAAQSHVAGCRTRMVVSAHREASSRGSRC
ncbi:MAG: hypothetical protein R3E03_00430 [Novosphingobium sp.]